MPLNLSLPSHFGEDDMPCVCGVARKVLTPRSHGGHQCIPVGINWLVREWVTQVIVTVSEGASKEGVNACPQSR